MKSERIVVAAAGPVTGAQSAYGAQIVRAVTYAVGEINRSGGLLNREMVLHLEDDTGSPEQAVNCARKIVESNASVVIGHYLSDCSAAGAPVYARNAVLQIAPSSTNPSFTDTAFDHGWSTVFRTCGRDDRQGAVAANFIREAYPSAKVAILHNALPYGLGLTQVVRESLHSMGINEAFYAAIGKSESDLAGIGLRLMDESIDLLYVGGYYTEVGPLLRALREKGYVGAVMSGGANANQRLYELAGDASNGMLLTCKPDARLAPEAQSTVEALRRVQFEPEGYTLSAVAAVEVWATAVRQCNSTDPVAVAKALREQSFESSYGPLSFDPKGDVTNPAYAVHQWHDGAYHELTT